MSPGQGLVYLMKTQKNISRDMEVVLINYVLLPGEGSVWEVENRPNCRHVAYGHYN